MTCENALEVYGFLSTGEMLDQQLNSTEEEEVAEDRAAFFNPVERIKLARKYMCQIDIEGSRIVMCNKLERNCTN
jgi:hypothetical protein